MPAWQVLILCGPAGTGKSSVARALFQAYARPVHLQLAPLRAPQRSGLATFTKDDAPDHGGYMAETDEARAHAAGLARDFVERQYRVIVEDVIESPEALQPYLDALTGTEVRAVTLLPSLEELASRDAMQPVEARQGTRLREVREAMAERLGAVTIVLDTSRETVDQTVSRILGLPV